ncbi:Crp/Fnr family transcriptional regulator [Maribacter sp. 1_MG-2023]|uniref:Crp/Fnr family transcriptional regulator n=1 Tax=Maribacter sp. 1_MG-2023 TaxID=3062677 RepID=UPI0026E1CC87|nr:Crp/Fnr family transcriptional regulator [Maribacter sp. 1_MG-2023]MDO6470668.1 Crp/Fnr family transcriptional regulator [Maribacter sp. 1_MG-2023]
MTDYLKRYFEEKTTLSNEHLYAVVNCFSSFEAKKNEIVIPQNKISKNLFFVKKGCLRVVCTRDNGQEWTRQIAIENDFITIFPSFIEQNISASYLQAIEPSSLYYISHTDFIKLNATIPTWRMFYLNILEATYVNSIKRIEQLITMSGKHLYDDFKNNQTELIERLPNKVLASYLGLTQETLSRLKAKNQEN